VDVDKGARRALVQISEGLYMMRLQFEWDEEKAAANLRKHSISFEECITAFGDPKTLTIFDEEHWGPRGPLH
jgi:hypothetical protein